MSRMKQWNESFKRLFESATHEEPLQESVTDELRTALDDALFALSSRGEMNIKAYEVAFQDAIEKVYPDHAWWEVTDCNIFFELFETRDLEGTVNAIIDQLKPEFKESVTELFDVKVDATEFGGHGNDVSVLGNGLGESCEKNEAINESIDDVKKIKKCIKSWVTGNYDIGGQNSAYFAKWLAQTESGLDWEKIAEVAYLIGYDVYKSSYGYFGDEDYLIVYPGDNPDLYAYDFEGEDKEIWDNEIKKSLVKVESFNSKSTNEDDEIEELFDVTVDAHNFGGSNNNVGIGGKMFESADAQYVYENGKGEAVDVFVKEDEDGNFYWEDNVSRSDDTFSSREEALDDCEQFVMSEAPGIVFKRLNEKQLTEEPKDIPRMSFEDVVNKNWKADSINKGKSIKQKNRTGNAKQKTIRPYNPKQKGLDDKILSDLQNRFGGEIEETKQGKMWVDTDNSYNKAKKYIDRTYGDASFTFDESISNGHGLNINAPITVNANGASVPFMNGAIKKESFVRNLKESLARLTEAEMSPEDRADSDLIRGILDKVNKRKNAKLSPDELAVMDKYGIVRDDGELYPTNSEGTPTYNRPMEQDVDTDNRDWSLRRGTNYRNGDPSKINYADRARKTAQRQANATYGHDIIPTARQNKHRFMGGGQPDAYNKSRRHAMEYAAGDDYRAMQATVSRRNQARDWVDSADQTFANRVTAARAQFDRAMDDATTAHRKAKTQGVADRDRAQSQIDTMLRRKPKTEGVECRDNKHLTEGTFRGVPNTEFISHGAYSDPEVSTTYEGKTYIANYWEIEDSMYDYYKDEKRYAETHNDSYAQKLKSTYTFDDSDEDFEKFLINNADSVISDIVDMGRVAGKAKLGESKKLKEAPMYDLSPEYDSRQSFYRKARVDTGAEGKDNKLYSYDTLVAEMVDGRPVVYGTYSQTTLRHIKEWLKQHGFKAETSKQIMADYGAKNEGLTESITITKEIDLEDFEFWSGARDRVKYLTSDDFRQLEYIIEEMYPDGCSETTINDIFWFEEDWIAEMLGYEDFEQLMEERESEE